MYVQLDLREIKLIKFKLISIFNQGKVEIQGTPNDLYKSNVDFVELVGIIESELKENAEKFQRSSSAFSIRSSRSSCISLESTDLSDIDIDIEIEDEGIQMEPNSKGKVRGSMMANYFTAGINWPMLMVLLFSFVLAQIIGSTFDYWTSIW